MLDERGRAVPGPMGVPADPVVGELRSGQQREALVVGLVQPAILVQERLGPGAPIAGDPREQDEVVVAAGDLERVELERAESLHDGL
ncbi:MAG: hypothetical protein ABJC39_10200, partial [Chloroflexota bacterium]